VLIEVYIEQLRKPDKSQIVEILLLLRKG
jgi:hypothetical protein